MSRLVAVPDDLWGRDRAVLVDQGTWPTALVVLDLAYWSAPERPLPTLAELCCDWGWPLSAAEVLLEGLPAGHRLRRLARVGEA